MNHYIRTKEYYRLANIQRHIALIYINIGNFKEAEKYQTQATELIIEKSVSTYEMDIMNDKGWLLIAKKEYDDARKLFLKLIQKYLSPYLQSLSLQNLGFLEFECHKYKDAINYHAQSLQIANRYEMRDMAFEDYYKLGLCHEKLGEIGLAEHFYNEGYSSLTGEIDLGLRITGYRRKLLDAYIHFLRNNQRLPVVNPFQDSLSFTNGKTMKQIREEFHKGLLTLHMQQTKNANELCDRLKINTRTFFLHQKKLGLKRGTYDESQFKNSHFLRYVQSLISFNWKESNQQFENDLFRHLLTKYQNNKKKIAQVLHVSYQHVVQKSGELD
jgi:tetratricopeptide (TPR) repeat protein